MKKNFCVVLCALMLAALVIPAAAAETEPAAPAVQSETQAPPAPSAPPATEPPHTHSWDGGTVTKEVTCTESGEKTYTCACGETKTEPIGTLGHDFTAWSSADGFTHQRSCGKCGQVETGPHGMATHVTTAATCLAAGVKTHSCSDCGYSYTEEIPVSSTHNWGAWQATVESHSRSCVDCQKADSAAHYFDGGEVTVQPTCLEEGIHAKLCTTCEYIVYEVLPKSDKHTYDNVCDPDCNVCGAKREASHSFSEVWTKGVHEHWHACNKCGAKKDAANHVPGPAATEEKAQTCLTCGYVMTARLNHVHNFETKWTSDESGHWYACDDCEDQKEFAEHSYDGACDSDCNICGYQTDNAHDFDDSWSSDNVGHWAVCLVCGEVGEVQDHVADPDTPEDAAQICIECGYEMVPAQVHTHDFGEQWLSDEENHWQECECGEKNGTASHAWEVGTQNDDTLTYLCEVCQAERTEEAPEKPFPWGIVLIVLLLAAAGAVVALIFALKPKKGRFTK